MEGPIKSWTVGLADHRLSSHRTALAVLLPVGHAAPAAATNMHGTGYADICGQPLQPTGAKKGYLAEIIGAPEGIRTPDLCLRRAALYPAELRAQGRRI